MKLALKKKLPNYKLSSTYFIIKFKEKLSLKCVCIYLVLV